PRLCAPPTYINVGTVRPRPAFRRSFPAARADRAAAGAQASEREPLAAASLAAAGASTVVVGWAQQDRPGGTVRLLDLRAPGTASAQGRAIAEGVEGVHGLCCSPLEEHLAASYGYADGREDACQVFVWDLRYRGAPPLPVFRLHSHDPGSGPCGRPALELSGRMATLEWSPAKRDTLLAVSLPGGGGAVACRPQGWEHGCTVGRMR
ncbi:unnamed protein product, partial [Prorocentrum cordatum]